jgi:hypothetical protein
MTAEFIVNISYLKVGRAVDANVVTGARLWIRKLAISTGTNERINRITSDNVSHLIAEASVGIKN